MSSTSKSPRPAKEARVKVPSRATSRPDHIVCPACGSGELQLRQGNREEVKGMKAWRRVVTNETIETRMFRIPDFSKDT